MRFEEAIDRFLSADLHTLAVVVPWGVLGEPSRVRVAGHVVWAEPGEEWKTLFPADHTPWTPSGEGAYVIDRAGPKDATAWAHE
jgi:hypothetical protein